jgi:hypothetical protein
MDDAKKLQEANDNLSKIWDSAPEDISKPATLYLVFQNRWYAVVEDSSSVYIVASKDGQILAVAKSKAPLYQSHGVPVYYVEDTLSNPISPLKIISCNSIKNKKQKFVLEKIVPYL